MNGVQSPGVLRPRVFLAGDEAENRLLTSQKDVRFVRAIEGGQIDKAFSKTHLVHIRADVWMESGILLSATTTNYV